MLNKCFYLIMPVFLVVILLTGCAGKTNSERTVTVKIVAAKNINPNREGKASSIVLNIYEMKELADFMNADFFALYKNPKSVLGENYVSYQQFIVLPGETKIVKLRFQRDSLYMGVLAAFDKIDEAKWLSASKFKSHWSDDRITINLSKLQLQLLR